MPSINCVRTKFPKIIVKTDVNEFMNKSSQGCKCWQVEICNKIWWKNTLRWSNTHFESKYAWSAINKEFSVGNVHIHLESSPALKFTTNLELSSRERLKDVWCNFTLTFLVSFESNFGCQVVIWYWDGIGEMEFRLGLREQGSSKYKVAVWYRIRI